MPDNSELLRNIPVGSLGLIAMHGCEELGKRLIIISAPGVRSVKASTPKMSPLADMSGIPIL